MAWKYNPFTGNFDQTLNDGDYILVDGTRAFTGDQSMGGNRLTNNSPIVTSLPGSPSDCETVCLDITGRKNHMIYNSGTASWTVLSAMEDPIYYVDTANGTDSDEKGTATGTSAFATLTYALSKLPAQGNGFTAYIYVSNATYSENITVFGKAGYSNIKIIGTPTQLTTGTVASAVTGTGATQGSVTVSGTPFAPDTSTTVDADSALGGTTLNVAATTGFAVGDEILIGDGTARQEIGVISSISAGNSFTLNGVLRYAHTAGDADTVDLMKYASTYLKFTSGAESGNSYIIDYNDDDSLIIVGTFATGPAATDTFEINDTGTTISGSLPVTISNLQNKVELIDITLDSSSTFAYLVSNGGILYTTRVKIIGGHPYAAPSTLASNTQALVHPDNFTWASQSRGDFWLFASKVIARNANDRGANVANGGGLNVRNGTIFHGGTYGVYLTGNAWSDWANAAATGYHRIRNATNGIYATVGGMAFTTANNVYEGNTTNENAVAGSYGYID